MISWSRILYMLGLAVVEATPAALVLTLAGGSAWATLIGVVLLGALADWIILRRLLPQRQGPGLVVVGALLSLWAIKGQVGDGLDLLGGWDAVFSALFWTDSARSGIAYVTLLASLYAFWRGTRLTTHDSVSLHRLFRHGAVAMMAIIGVGFLGGAPDTNAAALATAQIMTFFGVGLVTIALASASEEQDQLHRMGWRGLLTLAGAVALVLLLGLLVASLFGEQVAAVGRALIGVVVLIAALIMAPLLIALVYVINWLASMITISGSGNDQPSPIQQAIQDFLQRHANDPVAAMPWWLSVFLQVFFGMLPVIILVALILLRRRRGRRAADADEERESLWSWSGAIGDLRDLLASLRRRGPDGGLRAALARMRGGDPVSRIRRSYIRLLLAGEAHEQPRAAPQTPGEYAPVASSMLPAAARPIDALTGAYERARYYPSGVTDADAEASERAWGEIDAADRRAQ